MNGKPYRGTQLVRSHPIARGLIASWLFNEGTGDRIHDVTLNEREGVLTGMDPNTDWVGAGIADNREGWALDLAGGTSAEHVLVSSNLGLTGYPFTMEARCCSRSLNRFLVFLADVSEPSVHYGLEVRITSGVASAFSRNTTFARALGTTNLQNAWHHIVGVWESDTSRKVFVDGVQEGSNTDSSTFNTAVDQFAIGMAIDSTPGQEFDGQISKVSVWDRALEDEEIARLYTDPYGMFYAPTVVPAAAGISIPVVMYHRMHH